MISEDKNHATVAAASTGTDGVLNAHAGLLLERAVSEPLMPKGARDEHEARFIDTAAELGWLTPQGRFNGTAKRSVVNPLLNRIQVELSLRCNLSCTYCYSESGPARQDVMDAERVCRLIAEADEAGVTAIDLTGGEFFIFKGWQETLQEARGRGLVVTIHTNGMLLTTRNVEILADLGIRKVQVSADSHQSDEHDSIRGVKGAHKRLMAGIANATAAGLNVRVVLMAHRRNIGTFVDSVRWFHEEVGIPVGVDRVVPVGGDVHDSVALSTKEYYELLARNLPTSVVEQRICDAPKGSSPHDVAPECGVAHSFLYVTADGSISLCPTMTHREEARFAGPSLFETGLVDAWQTSPLFVENRFVNCENATSRQCPAAATCGGGCRSNAYTESRSVTAPDYFACNTHKNPGPTFIDFRSLYARGQYTVSAT